MTMKNYFERKNIFDLIDIIKKRTSMFIPDKSINSLSTYLAGYDSCLELHSIVEKGVPLFKHFGEWLKIKFNWNLSSDGLKLSQKILKNNKIL